jgi:hypothetical protein
MAAYFGPLTQTGLHYQHPSETCKLDKKSPTDRRFLRGKGFGFLLGGKNEELYSVGLNLTIVVRHVKEKIGENMLVGIILVSK